ncbi:LysR substrate-binding domain-containing protein [Deinococcus oregonensis]|uniref:LysR substrate-binding domain-containing protein n=1 Tax=Deinococcus oregonensis TaxID=1805970 RepID=A0ABV6B4T0_9DEIO
MLVSITDSGPALISWELRSLPLLPSLLTIYRAQFPDAQVNIQILPHDQVEHALIDDRLDVAFAFGSPNDSRLGFHRLLEGHYQGLLPEKSPLHQEEAISPALLHERRRLEKETPSGRV